MAASKPKGGAAVRGAAAKAASPAKAAAAPAPAPYAIIQAPRPTRKPTLMQKLVVAIYVYFIPLFLALNALALFSRYTAIPWLL
jgi:hypothetical protein